MSFSKAARNSHLRSRCLGSSRNTSPEGALRDYPSNGCEGDYQKHYWQNKQQQQRQIKEASILCHTW